MPRPRFHIAAALVLAAALLAAGCRDDMVDQPRFEDYEPTGFFEDSASVRAPVDGTVAQGWLRSADEHFFYGVEGDSFATTFPYEVTRAVLERGQERYNVYCAPCHGYTGDGQGMVVQRGFARYPSSFHAERLRAATPGYFYDVITNGYGLMYAYDGRLHPEDRWAVVAYIRALQRSQNATLEDVPDENRLGVQPARPAEVERMPDPRAVTSQ